MTRRMSTMKTSKNTTNIGVIYCRVSTDEQAQHGVSLDMQLTRNMEYCQSHGIEVLEVITDAGISARDIASRSGMTRLMAMVEKRQIGHVIALKLDRLCRNTGEMLDVAATMGKRGVELHFVSEHGIVRTESADDEFMLILKSGLATRERKVIAERTRQAMQRRRERLEYNGGLARFGYVNVDGKLIPAIREQVVIRRIQELRTAGFSIRRIVRCLEEDGYVSRADRPYGKTQVERIIRQYEDLAA
jgi:site-specific DNA recombinase